MRKLAALLLLTLGACAGPCKDGYVTTGWGPWKDTSYAACDFGECCGKDPQNKCRCQKGCPCWKEADHLGKVHQSPSP